MRPKFYYIVLVLLISSIVLIDGKRSRGRSRGSSGSSSFWSRKSKSTSEKATQTVVSPPKPLKPIEKPKAAEKPKASAPVQEGAIKKDTANPQQSSPNSGRPIGWNVDGQKQQQQQQQHINPIQNANYPNSNPGSYPNTGVNYPNLNPHASYPNAHQGYPNAGAGPVNYPNSNPYAGYPNANPGYPNTGVGPANYPNSNYPHAGYPNNGAYPQYPQQSYPGHYGGMGGYGGGYGSSWFGGNKPGYGGYGALAGYGLKPKSGGFLGKHPVRNILGGLFVWYLISGLTSRPYQVYNYYNKPPEEREEITLPANLLTVCNENVTSLCVPGTYALCTTNNSILCVASMTSTKPCEDDHKENCITSTIKCDDMNDPICQNTTSKENTTSVSLPCFTNMTLDTTQRSGSSNVQIPFSEDHRYCVTALAIPDNSPINSTEIQPNGGNITEFSTISTTTINYNNISTVIDEKL